MGFPYGSVNMLPCVDFLDHHPILITLQDTLGSSASLAFRFESAWMTHDSFKNTIRSFMNSNTKIYDMATEDVLRKWNTTTPLVVSNSKWTLLARLGRIHKRQYDGRSNCFLNQLEGDLQKELNMVLYEEEMLWFQNLEPNGLVMVIEIPGFTI